MSRRHGKPRHARSLTCGLCGLTCRSDGATSFGKCVTGGPDFGTRLQLRRPQGQLGLLIQRFAFVLLSISQTAIKQSPAQINPRLPTQKRLHNRRWILEKWRKTSGQCWQPIGKAMAQ